ncbi:hypothetical protein [Novosphingobium sp. MBES04]|uniref:hypothetical protein n=1 Tax=Novosphingobium sp. MBES04 TaxID=1206458 RepID=UPI0011856D72|nr:hypothetical protein [Novosphingobium sp. MBES04]
MEAMAVLAVALPSQHRGEVSKDVLAEAYRQALGNYPVAAIRAMRDEALRRCQWFPTIRECLDMLSQIAPSNPLESKRGVVLRRISDERQARFEEAMARLAAGEVSQDDIDAMPDRWKRIGETRSHLWRCDCGSYVLRPRRAAPPDNREATA